MVTQGSKGQETPRDTPEKGDIGRDDHPGGRRQWFLESRIGTDRTQTAREYVATGKRIVSDLYLRASRQRHSADARREVKFADVPAQPNPPGLGWHSKMAKKTYGGAQAAALRPLRSFPGFSAQKGPRDASALTSARLAFW
jgi:hypothetical protein